MTDPAVATRDRVADLLERLTRVNLQVVMVAPPDDTRRSAEARARSAALAAGRGELFDEAVEAARQTVLRAFSRGGFSGTWAATDWSISVASPRDRLGASAAFEEAAMAEVVADLVDDDTLEILRASCDELVRSSGLPSPGSLSELTSVGRVAGWAVWVVPVLVVAALALWVGLGVGPGILVLAIAAFIAARNRWTGAR